MVKERKEPTISAIKPEQDEIARHRQRNKASRASSALPYSSRPVVVRSKLAPLALLLAMAAVAIAGYACWQLISAQVFLQSAEARIAELEGRLELSDDESAQSVTALQAKLKWADSEIRKLWGVSYDRNRKAIAANKKALDSIAAQNKKIQQAIKNYGAELKLVNDLIEAQQNALSQGEQVQQQLQSQLQSLTNRVQALAELETSLKNRIAANEQAIEAIDAFRRSVNRDLLQLKSAAGG